MPAPEPTRDELLDRLAIMERWLHGVGRNELLTPEETAQQMAVFERAPDELIAAYLSVVCEKLGAPQPTAAFVEITRADLPAIRARSAELHRQYEQREEQARQRESARASAWLSRWDPSSDRTASGQSSHS